jgi:hypothetical protein
VCVSDGVIPDKRVTPRATFIVLILLLGACSGLPPVTTGRDQFVAAAADSDWTPLTFHARDLQLKGLAKGISGASADLTVYLEGDGHAWENRFTPSRDPTPHDAVALKLARQDAGAKVLYLARPCQFLEQAALAVCDPRYWTSHRYAPVVIAVLNQVLDEAKQQTHSDRLRLVGYSGGAPLALLLAAHRDDVAAVVTVAGNLDPAAWSAYHGISLPRGSNSAARACEKVHSTARCVTYDQGMDRKRV